MATMDKLINDFYNRSEHKKYFNKALRISFGIIILISIGTIIISLFLKNNFIIILLYFIFSILLYTYIFLKITKNKSKSIAKKDKNLMIQILNDSECYNGECIQQLINYLVLQTKKPSLEQIDIFNILSVLSLIIDKKEESILSSVVVYILIQDFLYIKDLIKIHTDYEYIYELLNNILFEYNININKNKVKQILKILSH